ncbi:MAG: CHAT domain-containing protein, partial [Bacteroidetes bacterium]|nr:CHAT domain-containing protein [Bacteroidota bacterium]
MRKLFTAHSYVIKKDFFPKKWGEIQNNLGNIFFHRISGKRDQNLINAIEHFSNSLGTRSRKNFPLLWASTQMNLGVAYSFLNKGRYAENIDLAVKHYNSALEVLSEVTSPEAWALVHNNLANAYSKRWRGELAKNIEMALFHSGQALQIKNRQDYPYDWAQIHFNLGNAFLDRVEGNESDNLEKALDHFNNVLSVWTREYDPILWTTVLTKLGLVYELRQFGSHEENVEVAIKLYEKSLEVRKRNIEPLLWGETQYLLGIAYRNRIQGDQSSNIENAIKYYKNALEVRSREETPISWAKTNNNLGVAYKNRVLGSKEQNKKKAISYLLKALEIDFRAENTRRSALFTGNLALEVDEWEAAAQALMIAIDADQKMFDTSFISDDMRSGVLEQSQSLYPLAAFACLKNNNLKKAIELAEAGRTREISETLGRNSADVEKLRRIGFDDLFQTYSDRYSEFKNVNRWVNGIRDIETISYTEWYPLLSQAWEDYLEICSLIREQVGSQYSEYKYFMRMLPFEAIQQQSIRVPIVYLVATSHGNVGLILTAENIYSVNIGDIHFNSAETNKLSVNYNFEHLRMLWDNIMSPIMSKLFELGISDVTLIPTGEFSLFPLHAAVSSDGIYAIDLACIRYAPSARVLLDARNRTRAQKPVSVLGVASKDLTRAEFEIKGSSAYFEGVSRKLCKWDLDFHSSFKPDGELVQYQRPVMKGRTPFLRDIHIRQI